MTTSPQPGAGCHLPALPRPRPALLLLLLLLPPRLEAARCAVPVADPLTVKGRPGYSPRARPRELAEVAHIWRRTGVLAHVGAGPDESYMLIDKRHPHAEYEIMVMSAGARLRPGLPDHSPAFAAALGAMTA